MANAVAVGDEPLPQLLITVPEMCIKHEAQDSCSLLLTVRVHLPQETDFCITADLIEFRECFNGVSTLEQQWHLSIPTSIYFKVIDTKNELLAAQLFTVANIKSKGTRPRRNLGWVLF